MESENEEVVRRLLEAFERDDVDAQLALMDPRVEIVEWPESPEARREPALRAAGLTQSPIESEESK